MNSNKQWKNVEIGYIPTACVFFCEYNFCNLIEKDMHDYCPCKYHSTPKNMMNILEYITREPSQFDYSVSEK